MTVTRVTRAVPARAHPMRRVFFVTGTDTGVGKTVLTGLLVHHLRSQGVDALAVKPLASGGRSDARLLRDAQDRSLRLEDVNPWWFRAALTPQIAARQAGRPLRRKPVVEFLTRAAARHEVLLVEGAGGLLSPLGEDFDARDLIAALDAIPLVVAANRLGALNVTLLTWHALGPAADHARIALIQPPRSTAVTRTNADLLRERLGPDRLVEVPWLADPEAPPHMREWTTRCAHLLRPV